MSSTRPAKPRFWLEPRVELAQNYGLTERRVNTAPMTLATLLSINAIVALAYALGLLLVPATLLKVYGITSGPGERLMAQFFGVALLAVGLLTWFSRNVVDPSAQRAVILALLISQAVGLVVALLGTLSGVMNGVGWSAVAIYLLLALGYAYFQFTKSASPSR